jgi:uncharacterized membrane protein YciS (DUF1049 family)
MPIEEITDVPLDLATTLGSFGLWLKALGLVVIGWIIVQIISWFYNIKKTKKLSSIQVQLDRMEKKINKLTR